MQQSSSTKVRLIATALIVLFGPALFYYLITRGENKYKGLEKFGPRDFQMVNGKADTVYHTIGNFSLTDQKGKLVTPQNFNNKIYVANFFFTTCTSICPKMSEGIQDAAYAFKDDTLVKFISHTVNPEEDSVPVLFAYSLKYHAKPDKWYFVTGDKEQIYKLAREDYYLPIAPGNGGKDDFIHSEKLILIDTSKRIRGIYDGTDAWEIARLKDEIKVLEYECFGKVSK
ncbi:MAG: SCO family protein [Bacteroidia bacterium]